MVRKNTSCLRGADKEVASQSASHAPLRREEVEPKDVAEEVAGGGGLAAPARVPSVVLPDEAGAEPPFRDDPRGLALAGAHHRSPSAFLPV